MHSRAWRKKVLENLLVYEEMDETVYSEVAILEKMTLVLCNAEYLKKVGSKMLGKLGGSNCHYCVL